VKYTINELANSKGVSQLVREALLQMEAELDATNRQVEILSDALAESRREVAAKDEDLKLVLEALEYADEMIDTVCVPNAITAIKQALAAPVQKGAIGAEYQKSPWDEKGISMPPPEAPVDWKAEYLKSVESGCITLDELREARAELDATNRQVEILSDALAESRREVTWGVDWGRAGDKACVAIIKRLPNGKIEVVAVEYQP
jgi:hypothetical protein